MNPLYRILIPVGLGLLAAGTNFVLISRATKTTKIVTVNRDLAEGDLLSPECLSEVAVRADKGLFDTVVKSEDKATLYTQTTLRPMKAGELVFRADVFNPQSVKGAKAPSGMERWEIDIPHEGFVSNLRPLDIVGVVVRTERLKTPQANGQSSVKLGPYKFLGSYNLHQNNMKREPLWRVVLATPKDDKGLQDFLTAFPTPEQRANSIVQIIQSSTSIKSGKLEPSLTNPSSAESSSRAAAPTPARTGS